MSQDRYGRGRDRPSRGGYSPPRGGGGRQDRYRRSPPPRDYGRGGYDNGPKVQAGNHKITLAGIPDDMGWLELKDLGREYGASVTFARTFRTGNTFCGMLEFRDRADAESTMRELDGRRVQGGRDRLRITWGDEYSEGGGNRGRGPPERGGGGGGGGGGGYRGRDNGYDNGRDSYGDRRYDDRRGGGRGDDRGGDRGGYRRDDRGPPPRSGGYGGRSRSRGGDRRGGGRPQEDDEEIMTLFLKGLPADATDDEVRGDIETCCPVVRALIMRRDDDANCFVRFKTREDAEKALLEIQDGKLKVCGERVDCDMAKRNTRP